MLHPDAAGLCPFVPVSWYGVDRPWAVSGFAGTMMSQLTFAAAAAGAVAVAVAVGAALAALTDGDGVAPGEALALAPAAVWLMAVLEGPPVNARTAPSVRPRAIGMARGTAMRAARLCGRRRHAGLCPVRIQSTSMRVFG
jgi:hypothetical protein